MSNFVPTIQTTAEDIDAVNVMSSLDWYSHFKQMVDETSTVDIKYKNILFWQLCQTTFKSMKTFEAYATKSRDKLKMSIVDQREATSGQEIAQTNFDTLTAQAKTYCALHRQYQEMHTAVSKLYMDLYQEDFKQRKMPVKSKGQMRTMKDMTPQEIADIENVVNGLMK